MGCVHASYAAPPLGLAAVGDMVTALPPAVYLYAAAKIRKIDDIGVISSISSANHYRCAVLQNLRLI